ncbi:MAG TPA: hypothetical protein VG845_15500 [Dehalococcoidia bacterium]|jgi:hypothetical protein|nr:hypothetical protein [Dehalococcoidia bacterium]
MKLRKRRLRWVRAKAWRLVRTQWLMSFPLVALIVAGAAALGAFDAKAEERPRIGRIPSIPTPIPYVTPANPIRTEPLQVNFILVSTREDEAVLDAFESGLVWREILAHGTFEVLLVTNAEEEAAAYRLIERARRQGQEAGYVVSVDDRRRPAD